MQLTGLNGTTFFEKDGLVIKNITAITTVAGEYPTITMTAVDKDFRADFAASQVTVTGFAFDVKDGVRVEISEKYSPKYGAVRYLDGTPVPATITAINITVDATNGTFALALTATDPNA